MSSYCIVELPIYKHPSAVVPCILCSRFSSKPYVKTLPKSRRDLLYAVCHLFYDHAPSLSAHKQPVRKVVLTHTLIREAVTFNYATYRRPTSLHLSFIPSTANISTSALLKMANARNGGFNQYKQKPKQ